MGSPLSAESDGEGEEGEGEVERGRHFALAWP